MGDMGYRYIFVLEINVRPCGPYADTRTGSNGHNERLCFQRKAEFSERIKGAVCGWQLDIVQMCDRKGKRK